jgi:hypothetical protein
MNYQLYLADMKASRDGCSTEWDHYEADAILCAMLRELGYDEIVDMFEGMEKWYA